MKVFSFLARLAATLCLLVPQAVQADDVVKIGVTVSLTGKYDEPGLEQHRGIQMWRVT